MYLSTRSKFREGDEAWPKYLEFIGLPQLKEVRSVDMLLNHYVQDCGSWPVRRFQDVPRALAELPKPATKNQYSLLFLDAEVESLPTDAVGFRLLGHDLSDETHTSSLLNSGPWLGPLAPIAQRVNEVGLLSLDDAREAKRLLPLAWPDEPHAQVTIWALYEVSTVP